MSASNFNVLANDLFSHELKCCRQNCACVVKQNTNKVFLSACAKSERIQIIISQKSFNENNYLFIFKKRMTLFLEVFETSFILSTGITQSRNIVSQKTLNKRRRLCFFWVWRLRESALTVFVLFFSWKCKWAKAATFQYLHVTWHLLVFELKFLPALTAATNAHEIAINNMFFCKKIK